MNREARTGASRPSRSTVRQWGEPLAIGLLALAVRAVSLRHAPYVDEINHVMAAQSLLADGSLRLADGMEYTRGVALTYMIAGLFQVFGESLAVARIPALMAGVLLVVALFLWLRSVDGSLSAWIAAILLTLSPAAIYFSQQARFYSLQPLLVFVAVIAVYLAVSASTLRWGRFALLIGAALLSVWLAVSFQPAALIGAAVVGAWAVLALIVRWWTEGKRRQARTLAAASAAAALLVGVLLFAVPTLGGRFARMATMVDEWAAAGVGEPLFYVWHFERQYAALFALVPLFALLALLRRTYVAVFALVMFAVPVGIHSLLAWKHERYIAYALPFLFVIIGLGAAQAVHWIFPALRDWLAERTGAVLSRRLAAAAAVALLVLAGLFLLRGNLATSYASELISGSDAEWEHEIAYRGEADWRIAQPVLRDEVASSDVVVSSIELKAMHYFGRQDVLLSRDYQRQGEFGTFWKMRRPVVSTPESLDLLMSCIPSGIVLIEERQWRRPWGVIDETADFLERRTERIPVPPESRLRVFRWTDGGGGTDCGVVDERVRKRSPPTSAGLTSTLVGRHQRGEVRKRPDSKRMIRIAPARELTGEHRALSAPAVEFRVQFASAAGTTKRR